MNVHVPSLVTRLLIAVAGWTLAAAAMAQANSATRLECAAAVYPPYTYDDGGVISGIAVDLLTQAGRLNGLEIVLKILPFARIEAELKRGAASSVACAYAFGRTPERESYMLFTTVPLALTDYTLYAKAPRSSVAYTGVEALKGARIGVRSAFRVPDELLQAAQRGELELDYAREDELNFRKLERDRVDYVLANQDVGTTMIRRLSLAAVKAVQPAVQEFPTFVVFNKALPLAPQWRAALDKGLLTLRTNQTERRIREQYLR